MSRKLGMLALTAGLLSSVVPEWSKPDKSSVVQLNPSALQYVRSVDGRYLSFQIGFSHLTGGETWRTYEAGKVGRGEAETFEDIREVRQPLDLMTPRLVNLTKALAPLYIRYGGTTSNSVYFQNDDLPKIEQAPEGFKTVLTRESWKRALDFAELVDAKILTGLTTSPGVRDENGVWTPLHAKAWLDYTEAVGGEIYAIELMNEPNSPEPGWMEPHSAEGFGEDFAVFKESMDAQAPGIMVAGPSTAMMGTPRRVSSLDDVTPGDYIKATPEGSFDMLSYHFYPALSERCAPADSPVGISAENALSAEWLARPDGRFQQHLSIRDELMPETPIWLSETGTAACGGTRWQPTFLHTFRFADTHARLAKQGLDASFTHALIGGSNGIIDETTFNPNSSYWVAVLWRKLMGHQVLDAGELVPEFDAYAHCMRGTDGGATLLALNLGEEDVPMEIPGSVEMYSLSAPELRSMEIRLNDHPFALNPDNTVKELRPLQSDSGMVSLKGHTVSFIALPEANNPSCAA